jgi:hypothetical protein
MPQFGIFHCDGLLEEVRCLETSFRVWLCRSEDVVSYREILRLLPSVESWISSGVLLLEIHVVSTGVVLLVWKNA